MKYLIVLFLLTSSILFGQTAQDIKKVELEIEKEQNRQLEISAYVEELKKIDEEISQEQVWMKSYSSYLTALEVRDGLSKIRKRIKYLKKRKKTSANMDELNALVSKEKILASQIEQLKEKDTAPFSKLLTPPKIDDIPTITNPVDIFTGMSLIKTLNTDFKDYNKRKILHHFQSY